MVKLNFELPDGITFNSVEDSEPTQEDGSTIKSIACPNCSFVTKAVIFENYGRYSGKIFLNKDYEVWQGKLASNPEKSRTQLVEVFNKKVKDHLEKCKG
jgi:late competence protein required for DNA uptake (superfamily II DNA/RNA helicase)